MMVPRPEISAHSSSSAGHAGETGPGGYWNLPLDLQRCSRIRPASMLSHIGLSYRPITRLGVLTRGDIGHLPTINNGNGLSSHCRRVMRVPAIRHLTRSTFAAKLLHALNLMVPALHICFR